MGPSTACMHTSLASQRVKGYRNNGHRMAAKYLPYRQKYWRGIIFGDLAVDAKIAKLKSAKTKIFWRFLHVPILNDVTLVSYRKVWLINAHAY